MGYVTAKEAAEYLHIHPDTLRVKTRSGEIIGYKSGNKWLFKQEELDLYVQNGKNTHRQKAQGHAMEEQQPCLSNQHLSRYIKEETSGGIDSRHQAEQEYAALLKL